MVDPFTPPSRALATLYVNGCTERIDYHPPPSRRYLDVNYLIGRQPHMHVFLGQLLFQPTNLTLFDSDRMQEHVYYRCMLCKVGLGQTFQESLLQLADCQLLVEHREADTTQQLALPVMNGLLRAWI